MLQTSGRRYRRDTVIVSCIMVSRHTGALTANHPKTGGPYYSTIFPGRGDNYREL
jgi:hypothetical protein